MRTCEAVGALRMAVELSISSKKNSASRAYDCVFELLALLNECPFISNQRIKADHAS